MTLQSNLTFDSHISNKISKAKQQLGMIRRALYWAPKTAKLLAYKSLCRPHLEYASASWDPHLRCHVNSIEMVQHQAVGFIETLKGRASVSEAKERLGLEPLEKRRRNQRLALLMRILSEEGRHTALCSAYDNLIGQEQYSVRTKAQSQGLSLTYYIYLQNIVVVP